MDRRAFLALLGGALTGCSNDDMARRFYVSNPLGGGQTVNVPSGSMTLTPLPPSSVTVGGSSPPPSGTILVHGQPFSVTGSGLGVKNGGLILWDRGTDAVGTVNAAYAEVNPSALGTSFPLGNLQNQLAATFNPTGAGPVGTNDPFNPNVLAGCGYIVDVAGQGEDVDVNLTFSAGAVPFPSAIYASFDHKVDPNWVLGLAPDGTFDDNLKVTNYNQGNDDYGSNFRYWSFGKAGSAGTSGNVDKIKVGVEIQGLQNSIAQVPDNNGHSAFWPATGDNWSEISGALNPYFSQWITYQNRVTISSDPTVGQDILWQQPCARSQVENLTFGQIVNYHGVTDDTTATRRSYTFGGFNRSGGSAGSPTTTQFRYLQNPLLDYEPGQVDVPRLYITDTPVWDNSTIRQYQRIATGGWTPTQVNSSDFWQSRFLIGQTVYPQLWTGNGTLIQSASLSPSSFIVAPFTRFDYYISPTGSDSNSGTSPSSPWAITSLRKGSGITSPNFALIDGKGVNVGFMPGTYDCSGLMINDALSGALQLPGGTAAKPNTFACCDANGNYSPRTATFDGKGATGLFGGHHSTGAGVWDGPIIAHVGLGVGSQNYTLGNCIIDGLRVTGFSYKGIRIGANSFGGPAVVTSPVIVMNCEFTGGGFNSGDAGDNCAALWLDRSTNCVTAINNWFHDSVGPTLNSGDHFNAIILWGGGGSCTGTVITKNTCFHAGNIFGKEGGIQGTVITNNYVDVSNLTAAQSMGIQDFTGNSSGTPAGTQTTTIANNIVIGWGANAANSWDSLGGVSTDSQNTLAWRTPVNIFNNTVVNMSPSFGLIVGELDCNAGENGVGKVKFYNNIYWNKGGGTGALNGNGNYRANPQSLQLMDYNLVPASGITYAIASNTAPATTTSTQTSPAAFATAYAAAGGIAGVEAHTISGAPTFVLTGTYAAQYQLAVGSLGKATGSSNGTTGGTPTDMGAWGNGATQIGCTFAT